MIPTEEKITSARIKITYSNPFFAYLSLYLTIEEDKKGIIPENCGMAVSPKGRLLYRKEFVDKITDAQLVGVLNHEICHLALLHIVRGKQFSNHEKWNVACDVASNTILIKNGYELPKGCLMPNNRNEFVIMNKIIKDVDSKSAEEICEELPEIPDNKRNGFDYHDTNGEPSKSDEKSDEKGSALTESELQELETEWFNRTQTAMVMAQQKGKLPMGMSRYLDKLKDVEINWRIVLRRFIQQSIPNDYTFQKRSKRGAALNIYLPSVTKEKINIAVGVDTSGSIEQGELTKFLSEIIGIARAFREIIDMRIMFHDVEVQADYPIKNGSIPKIMAMTPKGGGGTSHIPLMDKVKKDIKDCKCLICFTDGWSDLEDINLKSYKFPKLFIINKKGNVPDIKKEEAVIIKLRGE